MTTAPSTTWAAVTTSVGLSRNPDPTPPPEHVVASIRTTPEASLLYTVVQLGIVVVVVVMLDVVLDEVVGTLVVVWGGTD
jgi:hypothetical protein